MHEMKVDDYRIIQEWDANFEENSNQKSTGIYNFSFSQCILKQEIRNKIDETTFLTSITKN